MYTQEKQQNLISEYESEKCENESTIKTLQSQNNNLKEENKSAMGDLEKVFIVLHYDEKILVFDCGLFSLD